MELLDLPMRMDCIFLNFLNVHLHINEEGESFDSEILMRS